MLDGSDGRLYSQAYQLAEKGANGILLSGGSDVDGSVPTYRFADTIKKIKKDTKLKISAHTGIVNSLQAQILSGYLDMALVDIPGDDETIHDILGLDACVADYESSLKELSLAGIPIAPHIIVGLHNGQLKGEFKALEIVRKDRIELSLVIAGDGPEISSLRDLISHEWVEDYIDIKGRISEEEILRETQAALLLVAPAATEFSPNFVLRGIAYQKPFLISREHGLPFKVPEEYLIDPADPESVAEKINQILSENGYMEAKAWVSSIDYSQTWDDVIEANLEVIKLIRSH